MNSSVRNLKILTVSIFVGILSACSSGSDSEAPTPPTTPPPTSEGPTWTVDVFEDEGNFKNRCENPRSGTDINGNSFPDQAGSFLYEKHWLRSWSNNTYLWYDEIQDQNPANFGEPLEYFAVLKTEATTSSGADKDQFHFSRNTADYQQQVSSGASAGYGFDYVILEASPPREVRIILTQPGSPAASQNILRGSLILEIDGADAVNGGTQADVDALNAGLSPAEAGETHSFTVREPDGTERSFDITSAVVTEDPVQKETVLNTATGDVGYMLFNTFGIVDAEVELINAMENFSTQGIDDLVIDLRYNGGGFLAISSQLGYMVAGDAATSGKTFETTVFNDQHPNVNPVTGQQLSPTPFYSIALGFSAPEGQQLPSLDLNRVFILSTAGTCSASEALINGLRGIDVEVILIGSTTCGKPYGFYATDNCGTTYFTVQFRGENEKGFGSYSDGFVPVASDNGFDRVQGCQVADDYLNPLGDPSEGMLSAALNYQATGSCPAGAPKPRQTAQKYGDYVPADAIMNTKDAKFERFLEQNRILGHPSDNR